MRVSEIVVEVLHSEFDSVVKEFESELDKADHLIRIEKDH